MSSAVAPARLTLSELTRRLEAALARRAPAGPAAPVLALDADGTLWSGDLSDDVFLRACRQGLLEPAAEEPLARLSAALGLRAASSASELALGLFDAHGDGRLAEATLYEVMTWCYAGLPERTLADFLAETLAEVGLEARVRPELRRLVEWSRAEGLRPVVVSATPRFLLAGAIPKLLGIPLADLAGPDLARAEGRFTSELAAPVPYAEGKVTAARRFAAGARPLAALGDSPFDLAMLRDAELGVAVNPKPSLRARLAENGLAELLLGPGTLDEVPAEGR